MTAVGDRYVVEEMRKEGYNVGGEQSGHVILMDYNTTGDGQLTAVQLTKIMKETGKKLSELARSDHLPTKIGQYPCGKQHERQGNGSACYCDYH